MPWTAKRAYRHTHKAKTPRLKTTWRKAANNALKYYGDEGLAVRVANSVVNKMTRGKRKSAMARKTIKRHGNAGRPKSESHRAAISRALIIHHRKTKPRKEKIRRAKISHSLKSRNASKRRSK